MNKKPYSTKVFLFNFIGCLVLAVAGFVFLPSYFGLAGLAGAATSWYHHENS